MARRLKLMADYHCHPLWDYGESGDEYDPRDPTELPVTAELVAALNVWAAWFDSRLDFGDPRGLREVSPDEEDAFGRTGRLLWATLRHELGPDWHVVYHENGEVIDQPE